MKEGVKKFPNHTPFKANLRYPKVMDGLNRLYQYTDGVVHKVILGDVRRFNTQTGEFETHKGATHLKRVSERSSVIAKKVSKFQKKRAHEEINTNSVSSTQPMASAS